RRLGRTAAESYAFQGRRTRPVESALPNLRPDRWLLSRRRQLIMRDNRRGRSRGARLKRAATSAFPMLRIRMADQATKPLPGIDLFSAKRAAMRREVFEKPFLLGGWLGSTDTYKPPLWAAVPDIAVERAGYALTMRRSLPEPGADNQLIMAGHEAMLAQWFHRPLRRQDILLAQKWYAKQSAVQAFPHAVWESILKSQAGED